ncbi:MAG: aminotransferase class III-fold pyridoxal phosphate-dependent enzyme [Solirubrobacteraceae bacterium]
MIDRQRLASVRGAELDRFAALRPRSAALARDAAGLMPRGVPQSWMALLYDHPLLFVSEGRGSRFTDVDGHEYADFNIADTSAFCGHAPEPTQAAVADRLARGGQFLLPVADAAAVARELGRRYGLPAWQFTLAATTANVEVFRLARYATGRTDVVLFDGHYHGHADELQAAGEPGATVPENAGIPPDSVAHVRLVPFNDLDALEAAVRDEQVACVLAEPGMTNNQGVIQPDDEFHAALRRVTAETGTLLVLDETHTQICGPGGLTARWGLEPDLVTLGKSIGGGVPVGAYGMTPALRATMESGDWIATGGTLLGSALQMAACRATLEHVLVDDAYERAAELGSRLADGIERVAADAGLPWAAHRLYPRSGYSFSGTLPRNAAEARADLDPELWSAWRAFAANRGVWEAIDGAGPAASVATGDADVDRYLDVLAGFVGAVTPA